MSSKRAGKRASDPIHPGEILGDELAFIGMKASALAEKIGVPKNRLYQIIRGMRSITADTAIRLGVFFKQTPDFWLGLQNAYELDIARKKLGSSIKIKPYEMVHAATFSDAR